MSKLVLAVAVALLSMASVARAGDGVDLLRYAPDDTAFYVVVDLAAARDQPAFQALFARLPAGGLLAMAKDAKIDPLRDLDTIAVAGAGTPGAMAGQTIVFEGPGTAALAALVFDQGPSTHKHGADYFTQDGKSVARTGARLIYTDGRDIEQTLVAAARKHAGPAAARALLAQVDTGAAAWSLLIPSAAQQAEVAKRLAGARCIGVTFAVRTGDQVELEVRLIGADAASGRKLRDWFTDRIPAARQELEHVHVSAADSVHVELEGARVRVTAKASADDVVRLLSAFATAIQGPSAPAP